MYERWISSVKRRDELHALGRRALRPSAAPAIASPSRRSRRSRRRPLPMAARRWSRFLSPASAGSWRILNDPVDPGAQLIGGRAGPGAGNRTEKEGDQQGPDDAGVVPDHWLPPEGPSNSLHCLRPARSPRARRAFAHSAEIGRDVGELLAGELPEWHCLALGPACSSVDRDSTSRPADRSRSRRRWTSPDPGAWLPPRPYTAWQERHPLASTSLWPAAVTSPGVEVA